MELIVEAEDIALVLFTSPIVHPVSLAAFPDLLVAVNPLAWVFNLVRAFNKASAPHGIASVKAEFNVIGTVESIECWASTVLSFLAHEQVSAGASSTEPAAAGILLRKVHSPVVIVSSALGGLGRYVCCHHGK